MSQRAKAREAAAREREEAEKAVRLAEIVKEIPGLLGERRIEWGGDHLGHLSHECGNSSWCSCGAHLGIFSIVVPNPEDMPPSCEICKARKIGQFAWMRPADTRQ